MMCVKITLLTSCRSISLTWGICQTMVTSGSYMPLIIGPNSTLHMPLKASMQPVWHRCWSPTSSHILACLGFCTLTMAANSSMRLVHKFHCEAMTNIWNFAWFVNHNLSLALLVLSLLLGHCTSATELAPWHSACEWASSSSPEPRCCGKSSLHSREEADRENLQGKFEVSSLEQLATPNSL